MIDRYTRERMGALWSVESKYRAWLDVELAAVDAWAELGAVPKKEAAIIRRRARIDSERVDAIEREVKHDVIAFLTAVGETVGASSRHLHKGLTSSDVVDTAQAMLMRDATDILIEDLEALYAVLKRRALEFQNTAMIGRTHGIHAEPITFGLKLLIWYEEIGRHLKRLRNSREEIAVGKLSGAVGTYAHVPPEIEELVCRRLRLKPAPVSSQIIGRDRHAAYLSTLAVIASSIDKFAVEIRHLQRTEVREAEEFFSEGQKGSSAMPHKRNPVGCENVSGLARVIRSNAQAAFENVALWHERDISHSSAERVIVPDSSILLDFITARMTDILDRLIVYPARMRANIESTGGLVFSQKVLLALTERGLSREEAYAVVQKHAMKTWVEGGLFKDRLAKDAKVRKVLAGRDLDRCFSMNTDLKQVASIFKRVLSSS